MNPLALGLILFCLAAAVGAVLFYAFAGEPGDHDRWI